MVRILLLYLGLNLIRYFFLNKVINKYLDLYLLQVLE